MSRRLTALVVVACLVVGVVGLFGRDLVSDLVSGALGEQEPQARPLSAAEAQRLATMRQRNWDDRHAGVRATIGDRGQEVHAVGWVDWQRPLAYLALSGDQPGVVTELVQATPDLVATRPGPEPRTGPGSPAPASGSPAPANGSPAPASNSPAPASNQPEAIDPHPPPPPQPPDRGWQVRRPGTGMVDTLVTLLFTIAAEEPDAADLLARSDSQWLGRDQASGHDVDVLLGPAVPPSPGLSPAPSPAPVATPSATPSGSPSPLPADPSPTGTPGAGDTSLAAMGGAVQYWLDEQARLHRLEALLAADVPVRVDLDRQDRTEPVALDLLGGAALDPRPATDEEAETLSRLRERNLAAGGGEVSVTVPTEEGTVRATGWLDWHRTIAYLALSGADGGLVYADQYGVARLADHPATDSGAPPVPIPSGDDWEGTPWLGRGAEPEPDEEPEQDEEAEGSAEQPGDEEPEGGGQFDLDLLLNEALSLGGEGRDDVESLRETAVRLRSDTLSGTPVTVYELPREIETDVTPGRARMRYWVGEEGGLVRLEVRTTSGGFGQLDLAPGEVPYLG